MPTRKMPDSSARPDVRKNMWAGAGREMDRTVMARTIPSQYPAALSRKANTVAATNPVNPMRSMERSHGGTIRHAVAINTTPKTLVAARRMRSSFMYFFVYAAGFIGIRFTGLPRGLC